MTRMTRVSLYALPALLVASLASVGCSDDGGSSSTGTGAGGTPAAGGTGTAGTGTAGTGTAGTGTAGTGAGGTGAGTDFSPACSLAPTAAGLEIKKDVACTAEDPQLCYRPCGPNSVGWKSETCVEGVYAEGECEWPPGDYSCFAIPAAIDTAVCPDAVPQATMPCDVPECTLCNLAGNYADSGGTAKVGYCVCGEPNGEGERSWTCASDTAWPCPGGSGCQ